MTWLGWRLRLALARHRERHLLWLVAVGRDVDAWRLDCARRFVDRLEVDRP